VKSVNIKSVKEGDVLAKEVIVGKVCLFDAGTVLAQRSIEIMTVLGVEKVEIVSVGIVSKEGGKFRNIKEVYKNIDERFSYVEHDPFMMSLKYIVKDVVSDVRGVR